MIAVHLADRLCLLLQHLIQTRNMLLQLTDPAVTKINNICKDHCHQEQHAKQDRAKHIKTDLGGQKYIVIQYHGIIGQQTDLILRTVIFKDHTGCHIAVAIQRDHLMNHPVYRKLL